VKTSPRTGGLAGEMSDAEEESLDGSSSGSTDSLSQYTDPRLAFLECAEARLWLLRLGEMTLDEAIDPAFVDRFRSIWRLTCACEREFGAAVEHADLDKIRARWRWRRRWEQP
jgi:hypothetical protein